MRIHSSGNAVTLLDVPEDTSPAVLRADRKNILGSGLIHPELVRRVKVLIEKASAQGMDLYVTDGFRTSAEQKTLKDSGRNVTSAGPGESLHNYGLAVDIAFQGRTRDEIWGDHHDWKKLGSLGKESGLYWGGDWHKEDKPHFGLIREPIKDKALIKSFYGQGGFKAVWKAVSSF